MSVVLPTFNRVRSLRRSVVSVLEQETEDLELIVVDDGSEDGTDELVDSLGDNRVHYLRHEVNRGVSAARNTGIRGARGTFISFQDSDDLWLPGKLRRQLETMRSSPADVGVVYTGVMRQYPTHREPVPHAGIAVTSGDVLQQVLHYNLATPPALLVRSEVFTEVGGFDERMDTHEDWELIIRLANRFQFRFTGDYLVSSPYSRGGVNDVNADRYERALLYLLEKHRDLFDRFPGAVAALEGRMGAYMIRQGATLAGRRHMSKALRLAPFSPFRWAAYTLSLLGPAAFSRIFEYRQLARFSSRHGE